MNSAILTLLSAAAAAGQPPAWLQFYLPMAAMFLGFWFLIFRPQMKRQRDLQAKIGGIKKGDQVLTGFDLHRAVLEEHRLRSGRPRGDLNGGRVDRKPR